MAFLGLGACVKCKISMHKNTEEFQRLDDSQLSKFSEIIFESEKEVQRLFSQGTIPPEVLIRWVENAKLVDGQARQVLQLPTQKVNETSSTTDNDSLRNLHLKIRHLVVNSPLEDGSEYVKLIHTRKAAHGSMKKSNLEDISDKKRIAEKASKNANLKGTKFELEESEENTVYVVKSSVKKKRLVEQDHVQLENLTACIVRAEKEVSKSFSRGTILPEMFFWVQNAKQVENQAKQVLQSQQENGNRPIDHETPKNLNLKILDTIKNSPINEYWREVKRGLLSPTKGKTLQEIPDKKQTPGKLDVKVKRTKSKQLSEVDKYIADAVVQPSGEIAQAEPMNLDCSNEGGVFIYNEAKTPAETVSAESRCNEDIESMSNEEGQQGDDILHSSLVAEESALSQEIKNEKVEILPTNLTDQLKRDRNAGQMSSSRSVQEQPMANELLHSKVESVVAIPSEVESGRNEERLGVRITTSAVEIFLDIEDIEGSSIASEVNEECLQGDDILHFSLVAEESALSQEIKNEKVEILPTNLTDQLKRDINAGQMSSSRSVQEQPMANELLHSEVASNVAIPSEQKLKKNNLELERDLSLEQDINKSDHSASEGSLIGIMAEPNRTSVLPSSYEVETEVERVQEAVEISRSMDSPFLVTVSVAGELSEYIDLKLKIFHGLSSSKGHIQTNEFKYCDFTSDADDYCILMKEKTRKMEVDQSNAVEGDLSSPNPPESSKNTTMKLPEGLILRKGGCGLTSPPEEEKWRQASVMILMDNAFPSLPSKPECPNLVLLFVQRNIRLRKIPESFFSYMHVLRGVDLSDCRIRSLPSSLFELDKLQVLMLRNCKCLARLPKDIGRLKGLEVLDLHGTELYTMPDEIENLTHLRHLQLTFYGTDDGRKNHYLPLVFLSPNIISGLESLESLSIGVHPEDIRWIKNAETIMGDLAKLKSLSYLEFYFPRVELLEQFTKMSIWENIRSNKFRFVVGQNVKRIVDRVPSDVEIKFNDHSRCLRFVNGNNNVQEAIKKVLKHVTALYLDHHLSMCSLSEMGITTSKDIKFFTVRECPGVEVIIDGEIVQPAYPSLQHLGMHYLWKLESISRSRLVEGSFSSLSSLILDTCPRLEFILSESMVQCLCNLDELVVENCERVEEIIRKTDEDEPPVDKDIPAFPRLSRLKLCHLPQLHRFWWKLGVGGHPEGPPLPYQSFKALRSATVWSCRKLDLVPLKSIKKDFEIVDRDGDIQN